MLRLSSCFNAIGGLFFLLLSACGSINVDNGLSGVPPEPERSVIEERAGDEYEIVNGIATAQGVVGSRGSNFAYIDRGVAGNYLIVYETFSSRAKYKVLTPVVGVAESGLFIDCSYIRSIENRSKVSVGSYCRGEVEVSSDLMDDAVSDEHLLSYSSDLSWLVDALSNLDCTQAQGLQYYDYRVVRCDNGEGDETTEGLSIHVLSSTNEVLLSMEGFEFCPVQAEHRDTLVFWRLGKESQHKIVEKNLGL